FSQAAGGNHLKVGYEWFRTHDTGGKSPSATDNLFIADFVVDDRARPLFDSTGHLMPVFTPGETVLARAFPERGAALDIDTSSAFVQDHWDLGPRLSVDLGARFEHVTSVATPSQIRGVKASSIVPRLAGAYDFRGDGRHVVRA